MDMNKKRRELTNEEYAACTKIKQLWQIKQAKHRDDHGRILSQESASVAMGWQTQATFFQYMNGKLALNLDALLKLSAYFDVPPTSIAPELAKKLKGTQYENINNELQLVSDNPAPYSSELNKEAMDKATTFLFDNYAEVMAHKGASWTSQMLLKLYDLYQDPASEQLNNTTILKLINNG